GGVEAPEDVHAGRLARAARAHDGHELPVVDPQVDPREGAHLGLAGAVDLADLPELDERRAGARRGGHGGSFSTTSTTTCAPGASSPLTISVITPSVTPGVTGTGSGAAPGTGSRRTQTR